MLLLISVPVIAIGQSGTPFNFFNVEKCVGDIKVRIYPISETNYTLINCVAMSKTDWTCPCNTSLYILTSPQTDGRFSALVQYYIGQTKNFTASKDGKPTQEEIYNEALKRVYTIKDITLTKNKEMFVDGALSDNKNINNILLGIVIIIGIIIFIVSIVFVILWVYDEKIRAWMKLNEDDKMTILMILKKIFSREDIARSNTIQNKKQIQSNKELQPNKKIEKKIDTQDEIRKILEGLDK
jgi:hypothetical protein